MDIKQKRVEAAAKALYESAMDGIATERPVWDRAIERTRENWRNTARIAVEAADAALMEDYRAKFSSVRRDEGPTLRAVSPDDNHLADGTELLQALADAGVETSLGDTRILGHAMHPAREGDLLTIRLTDEGVRFMAEHGRLADDEVSIHIPDEVEE